MSVELPIFTTDFDRNMTELDDFKRLIMSDFERNLTELQA